MQIEAAAGVTPLSFQRHAQHSVTTLAALEMTQADGRLRDRLREAEVIALASAGRNAGSRDVQEEAAFASVPSARTAESGSHAARARTVWALTARVPIATAPSLVCAQVER